MTTPLSGVLEYLEPGANENLTDEVAKQLSEGPLGAVAAEELVMLNAIQLANRMKEAGVLADNSSARLKAATALLEIFRQVQITAHTPVTATPSTTTAVTKPATPSDYKHVTAPAGTTASKKSMTRSSELAEQLGLPTVNYTGCTFCLYDLTAFAKREGIKLEVINICPNCTAVFVAEQKVHCYACGSNMPSSGTCTSCGAKVGDSEEQKIMTIYACRQNAALRGQAAISQALVYMQNASLVSQTLPKARQERWIQQAEEGGQPGSQVSTFQGSAYSFERKSGF